MSLFSPLLSFVELSIAHSAREIMTLSYHFIPVSYIFVTLEKYKKKEASQGNPLELELINV